MRTFLAICGLLFMIESFGQQYDAQAFSWYFASYPPRAQKADQQEPCNMPIYFRQFTGRELLKDTRSTYDPTDSVQNFHLAHINGLISSVGEPCKPSTYICTDVQRFVIDSSLVALQIAETVHRNPRKTVVGYNKYTRSLNLPPNSLFSDDERFELGSCRMCADSIYAVDSPFATTYIGLILHTDSMHFFDVRSAFTDSTWMAIEQAALRFEKLHPEKHMNSYHYRADLKRALNCTLHPDGILVNFGNEGEFYGYFPHLIPWAELPVEWKLINN